MNIRLKHGYEICTRGMIEGLKIQQRGYDFHSKSAETEMKSAQALGRRAEGRITPRYFIMAGDLATTKALSKGIDESAGVLFCFAGHYYLDALIYVPESAESEGISNQDLKYRNQK